jgi:hypothetical protein
VSDGPPWSKKCLAQRKESLSRPTIERKYLRVLTNILCDNPTTCSSSTPPQTGLGCLSNSQMLSSRARTIERHPQLSAQEALRLLRSMPPPPPHSFFHSISPPPPSLPLLLSVCLSQQHHPKDFYESSSACQKRIVSIPLAPAARLPDAEYRILSLAARTKGGPYLQLYVDR